MFNFVTGNLFKINEPSLSLAMAVIIFTFFILFLNYNNEKRGNLKILMGMGLLLALIFSSNLISILILSELLFIGFLLCVSEKLNLNELRGTGVRLVGLIFILGSISLNYRAESSATISFLKENAENFYSADYLFSIGSLFVLAGLFEILFHLSRINWKQFRFETLLVGLGFLIAVMKYSSAHLFSVLQEVHSLIQWVCVIFLLLTAIGSLNRVFLLERIKLFFLNSLFLSFSVMLPIVADGEGSVVAAFLICFSSFIGVALMLFIEQSLRSAKGDFILFTDLQNMGAASFIERALFMFSVFLTVSFPIVFGFLIYASALKFMLAGGFYWLGFWALFAVIILWLSAFKLMEEAFLKSRGQNAKLLWRKEKAFNVNPCKGLFLISLAIGAPVVFNIIF